MKTILMTLTAFVVTALLAGTVQAAGKKPGKTAAGKLRHVVCFKYKAGTTPEQIAAIERAFRALKGRIPGITDFETGVNNSPEGLNKGFEHCYVVTFKDEEARQNYLPHPEHEKFVALIKPVIDDVFVIDYWTK